MTDIDRRKFLGYAAAAGAGLFLAHGRARGGSRKKEPSDTIRIALIGAGAQGQVLMNSCLKIPGVRFQAVCDIWEAYNMRRAQRMLDKFGQKVNAYEDYRQMLGKEKGLDAVLIATPDFWHSPQTVDCLTAGLHVYCEKEMSNTLEGARRMVRAARQTGNLLQIGHQRRSNPRYIHCYRKLIREAGILGRITTVNGQWNRAVQPDNGWPKGAAIDGAALRTYGYRSMEEFRNWRWYRHLGGGPIVDLGSHQIDIYNWFLDARPKAVVASGGIGYYEGKTHEWFDSVLATFEYETRQGKVLASYQTISTNSNQGYSESFMGDQGTLVISESASRGAAYREPAAPEWDRWVSLGILKAPEAEVKKQQTDAVLDVRETLAPPSFELPVKFDDPYHKPHLENFFNAVRGSEKLNCPAEIGYETAVTVLTVNRAVEAGKKIVMDPREFAA
ncbi:MAG TPA: Gfo/Idh/MocA family oxidoreductase [Bacteroidota bacterium]|nr:Gfo/Idh/MocA family oxidoreductase [Bacteroidota bacterium]